MPRRASGKPLRDESTGSAERTPSAEPHFLVVGHIRGPFGVRGEIRMQVLTDFPERFRTKGFIWLGEPPQRHTIEAARFRKDEVLLKLAGLDDRNAVEHLRGLDAWIPRGEAMLLPEGTYYIHDVVGLEVWTDAGERLGTVAEVLELPANDVYVVDAPNGEILLPAISEVVLSIDLTARRMTVHLLPGLV